MTKTGHGAYQREEQGQPQGFEIVGGQDPLDIFKGKASVIPGEAVIDHHEEVESR